MQRRVHLYPGYPFKAGWFMENPIYQWMLVPSLFQQLGKSSTRSCLNPFSCRLLPWPFSAGKNVFQIYLNINKTGFVFVFSWKESTHFVDHPIVMDDHDLALKQHETSMLTWGSPVLWKPPMALFQEGIWWYLGLSVNKHPGDTPCLSTFKPFQLLFSATPWFLME